MISCTREPLNNASSGGNLQIVKLFVDLGASIEEKDANGTTAVMNAASSGHDSIVRHLLDLGAATDVVDKHSYSLLVCAAQGGLTEIVRLLVARGFDVKRRARLAIQR